MVGARSPGHIARFTAQHKARERVSARRKRTKAKARTPAAKFGGGVLAEGATKYEGRKVDARGIINVFWAWAFPCSRNAQALLGVLNLPRGRSTLRISYRKMGSRRTTSAVEVVVKSPRAGAVNTIPVPMSFRFESPGEYEVIARLSRTRQVARIPFVVQSRKWPRFTKVEKQFIEKHPSDIPQVMTSVECSSCNTPYRFAEILADPTMPPKGILPFPTGDEFECEECGKTIHLRDVRGQIRQSLKQAISEIIKVRS